MTIRQALNAAAKKLKQKKIPSAHLDAEVLLLEALNKNRRDAKFCRGIKFYAPTFLYSRSDYKLNQNEQKVFNNFISRRLKREPVAYITRRKEFFGLDFVVNKNVLIPRPETEIIVEEVLKIVGTQNFVSLPRLDLIDVGTGSGCVAISILSALDTRCPRTPGVHSVYALDISREAIKVAEKNAEIILGKNHKIKFVSGDFSETLNNCKDEKFFVPMLHNLIITANLPYLSENNYQQTQPEIKNFEPKIALAASENGLALIKKLLQEIAVCRDILQYVPANKKNIFIFLEIDPSQAKDVSEFAKNILPSSKIKIIKDLAGKDRVIFITIQ